VTAALLAAGAAHAAEGQADAAAPAPSPRERRATIIERLEAGDYADAAPLLDAYLADAPDDAIMIYNAACVHCRAGATERAETLLLDSVKAGFRDFSHMQRDRDLAPLRARPVHRAIIAARDAADSIVAERRRATWRARCDDAYRFAHDEARRVDYLTALDEPAMAALRRTVAQRLDEWAHALFGAPLRNVILLVVPRPDDAARFVTDPRAEGRYRHGARELVAPADDAFVAHELVHALHHDDMDRRGQIHPIWIQEGIAALAESYALREDGTIVSGPSPRDAVAAALAEDGRLTPWMELFAQERGEFLADPIARYAEVRTIFAYLAEISALEAWYRAYVEGWDGDATGARAIEAVVGGSLTEIEGSFRAWVRERPVTFASGQRDSAPMAGPPDPDPAGDGGAAGADEVAADEAAAAGAAQAISAEAEAAWAEARAHYAGAEYAAALAACERVIAMRSGDSAARYLLALTSLRLGDRARAEAERDILAGTEPSLASLLANLLRR
jgi:hypothetical protein